MTELVRRHRGAWYDTVIFRSAHESTITREAFTCPLGGSNVLGIAKTKKDTNMVLSSQIPAPDNFSAKWLMAQVKTYNKSDFVEFYWNASVEFELNNRVVRSSPMSILNPVWVDMDMEEVFGDYSYKRRLSPELGGVLSDHSWENDFVVDDKDIGSLIRYVSDMKLNGEPVTSSEVRKRLGEGFFDVKGISLTEEVLGTGQEGGHYIKPNDNFMVNITFDRDLIKQDVEVLVVIEGTHFTYR